MIEVEKKFQPTKEQLEALLEGASFIKEKSIHDKYYDFPDFRIIKSGRRLRKRGDSFELKTSISTQSGLHVADEDTNEASILKKIGITDGIFLEEFTQRDMVVLCDYTTLRRKYRKDGFIIDVDEMDFGVNLIEIELIVETKESVAVAENKILDFAKSFGVEAKDLPLKPNMYLEKVRPDLYREIFRGKNLL